MGQRSTYLESLKNIFKHLLLSFFGFFLTILVIIFVLITVPFIIYRYIITKLLLKSWLCPNGITKTVSLGFGSAYAAEFLTSISSNPPRPSRNAIVQQSFLNGILPLEEINEMIKTRWLEATKHHDKIGKLKYTELQQFVVGWMGYLFWKEEPNFKLENHLVSHLPSSGTDLDIYSKDLLQQLLNKPFMPERSPWEIHIVYSCNCFRWHSDNPIRNDNPEPVPHFCKHCGKEEITVFVTRIHHCLGDGLAFMFALEELFGSRALEIPKAVEKPTYKMATHLHSLASFFHDLGCVGSFLLWRANNQTKLHCYDHKKSWRHYYERSEDIPLSRMKAIKKHFGVSFSALVMHCVSVVISKRLRSEQELKNFLLCLVIPLHTCRADRWINKITGAAYKLPLNRNMDATERLLACDKVMKSVNNSPFTQVLFPLLMKLMTFHVTPLVRFAFYNRTFGAAISNFSVPNNKTTVVNGKYTVVRANAAAAGGDGLTGPIFCTLGYNSRFHFLVTADQALMERHELKSTVDEMIEEVNALYEKVTENTTRTKLPPNGETKSN